MKLRTAAGLPGTLRDLLFDVHFEKVAALAGRVLDADTVEVVEVLRARNLHDDPEDNFALRADQYARLQAECRRRGLELVGLAHSHPPGAPASPSRKDYALARRWRSMRVGAVFHTQTGLLMWYTGHGRFHNDLVNLRPIHKLLLAIYAPRPRNDEGAG